MKLRKPKSDDINTIVVASIILIFVVLVVDFFYDCEFLNCVFCPDEYTEIVVLNSQGRCDYCNGCFCLNATFQRYDGLDWIHTPHIFAKIHNRNYSDNVSYYFANEYDLKDWDNGDTLSVRWCNFQGVGYRIRGVQKP